MQKATAVLAGSAAAGLIFYLTGKYLQKLYGFDPPYAYFWTGWLFETAAYLSVIVFFLTLAFILWRKFRNRGDLR
jgi:hypothetical protein